MPKNGANLGESSESDISTLDLKAVGKQPGLYVQRRCKAVSMKSQTQKHQAQTAQELSAAVPASYALLSIAYSVEIDFEEVASWWMICERST